MQHILNIPNILTLARIIVTPFIVYAILDDRPVLALALMVAAGITDMLDGAIARFFDQRTTVGSFLDPLADKLMLISMFVTLFIVDRVPLFLFLAVIFRDLIIVLGAVAYEMVTGQLKMQPSLLSKATTLFQMLYIVLLMVQMAWPLETIWLQIVMWTAFVLTFASGLHYMVAWTRKAVSEESASA